MLASSRKMLSGFIRRSPNIATLHTRLEPKRVMTTSANSSHMITLNAVQSFVQGRFQNGLSSLARFWTLITQVRVTGNGYFYMRKALYLQ